jgi:hypothetical protein
MMISSSNVKSPSSSMPVKYLVGTSSTVNVPLNPVVPVTVTLWPMPISVASRVCSTA